MGKKRCWVGETLHSQMEALVRAHVPSPSDHQINYWFQICLKIGIAYLSSNPIPPTGLQGGTEQKKNYAISIDHEFYADLTRLVLDKTGKNSSQLINWWLNLGCEIGLSSIQEDRVDLQKILTGAAIDTWFYGNSKIVPLPTIAVIPTPTPASPTEPIITPKTRKKSKFNPEAYQDVINALGN